MFLEDVRELGELIAVALVEAVGIEARAAGSDAEGGKAALPCPCFDMLAEAQSNMAIAIAGFHDESTDESVRCGLEMMLDGNFDPADDFVFEAGCKGGLIVRA